MDGQIDLQMVAKIYGQVFVVGQLEGWMEAQMEGYMDDGWVDRWMMERVDGMDVWKERDGQNYASDILAAPVASQDTLSTCRSTAWSGN